MSKTAELSAGPVRYRELGPPDGQPIVFVHGLLVDSRLWDGVADALSGEFRCLLPDWPMGSHQAPMHPDADLSPYGQAANIAEFIDSLGLERATIVGNDSGGAISQILATRHPERVERLVLTNCDMFDKFPPFPFTLMPPIARLPGGMQILQAPFRISAAGRATFNLLTRDPVDPELAKAWLRPGMQDAGVRADTRKLILGAHKRLTQEAAEKLRGYERPALMVWGTADRFFPLEYASRMAGQMGNAKVVEIEGAKTFVALDEPGRVAEAIGGLMRETPPVRT